MDTEEKMLRMFKESTEYLKSVSAFELMNNASLFVRDLQKLIDSQHLPASVLIGCLMTEVHVISMEADRLLLDTKMTKAFTLFKEHTDKTFIKKE